MPDKNQPKPANNSSNSQVKQVAEKIKNSTNVLIALSKNPSVDELSAAIGLTFLIDKIGKHATAIFSGNVPNAIEFLEPEKTFESNTNSLQDFIIALDKEKADHLRYKIEGEFVKVYITPYRTKLSEDDLEFSHGDFNVDLIIAINVHAEADLDSALSEYGRIKHDASSINISAAEPGHFADLEWGDASASSVSEMIADLSELLDQDGKLVDKSIATALLAGIVAATNRFSNEHTSANTLSLASKLMVKGADQQLISSSIPVDILTKNVVDMNDEVSALNDEEKVPETPAETEPVMGELPAEEAPKEEQSAPLVAEFEIAKDDSAPAVEPVPEPSPAPAPVSTPAPDFNQAPEPTSAPEFTSVPEAQPVVDEELLAKKPDNVPDLPISEPSPVEPADQTPTMPEEAPSIESITIPAPAEAAPIDAPTPELEPLAAPITPTSIAPVDLPIAEVPAEPINETPMPDNVVPVMQEEFINSAPAEPVVTPPAAQFQPVVDPAVPPAMPAAQPAAPDFSAPSLPMPGDGEILPPPPAPFEPTLPSPIQPAILQEEAPAPAATSPSLNGINPVMQDQIYNNDPGSFQIPGLS